MAGCKPINSSAYVSITGRYVVYEINNLKSNIKEKPLIFLLDYLQN